MQSKFNNMFNGTIKGNELRRTFYHIKSCDECKEVLLDEFSFYTTFNDLDNDLDFNYKKKLDEFLDNIQNRIDESDTNTRTRYIIISVIICAILVLLVVIAIRLVYR